MHKISAYILLSAIIVIIYSSAFLSFLGNNVIMTPEILSFSLLFNLIILGGGAILFIYLLYDGSLSNVFKNLYFKKENIGKAILYGIIACLFFILFSFLISYFYKEKNPLAEEIGLNLNIFLLIFIPIASSLSEEIFFRGLIQMQMEKKINYILSIIITSILFSIAHLEYKVIIEMIMTFSFSIILGYLIHSTKNIMAPITAHFLYNFIALLSFYFK